MDSSWLIWKLTNIDIFGNITAVIISKLLVLKNLWRLYAPRTLHLIASVQDWRRTDLLQES